MQREAEMEGGRRDAGRHSLNFLLAFLGFSVILSAGQGCWPAGRRLLEPLDIDAASSPRLPLSHPLTRFLCVFLNQ